MTGWKVARNEISIQPDSRKSEYGQGTSFFVPHATAEDSLTIIFFSLAHGTLPIFYPVARGATISKCPYVHQINKPLNLVGTDIAAIRVE